MGGDDYKRVVETLCDLYKDDKENLLKLFGYLNREEERCNGREKSGVWNMMVSLLDRKLELKAYTDDLIKQCSNDPDLEKKFVDMHLEAAKSTVACNTRNPADYLKTKESVVAFIGLSFWKEIPPTTQTALVDCVIQATTNLPGGALVAHVGQLFKASNMASKISRSLPYALSAAYLLYEIGTNIYKWHHNEISGKRCAKNVIDAAGALAGGISGGALGAAIGAFGGPIGIVIGGLAGGFLGAISGDALTNLLTKELFDLPKTVALEEAYNFLGINHRATDEEVRNAYKRKLLTCHPDKGGSKELFLKLQSCLGVIVVARGWKPS